MLLLPPAAGYARQYAFAQALQFVIFAVLAGAAGAGHTTADPLPGRPPGRRTPPPASRPRHDGADCVHRRRDHLATAGHGQRARPDPALAVAEMITLLAAGTGIWLELANAPRDRASRPARRAPR